MRKSLIFMALIAGASFTYAAAARDQANAELQTLDDQLPGDLINDPTRLDWPTYGPGLTVKGVQEKGIPGGGAGIQLSVTKATKNPFEVGTNAPISVGIKSGTDLVVTFYARTISSDRADGNGIITTRFQQNAAPYPGFGDKTFTITKDWQLYQLTAKSNIAIPRGTAIVAFQLGGAKQVVEIGQTIIVSGATSLVQTKTSTANYATTDLLPQLQGKGELINNPGTKANWIIYGPGAKHQTVEARNIPGTGGQALQVNVAAAQKNAWDMGVNIPITSGIAAGDRLLIAVLARAPQASTPDALGKLGVRVQDNAPPYAGFGDAQLSLGQGWKLLQLRTEAKHAIAPSKGVVGLHLGAAAQTVEIGQVFVLNTGSIAPQPAQ